ncbi:MAG: sulfate reduction electron transfer complex DsrMKJOP subunit DsrM [Deltaproteobacteria bacterium]|nr:sulfate reduction electron transfer complex DsrMKJOP subunit DsrM [Deltaproteobacteria bacterium]
MRLWLPLIVVVALIIIAYAGVSGAGMNYLFGVFIPYVAFLIFLIGFISRVVKWGRSPVPFRIPTTAGQGKSLPWIKENKIDNPSTTGGVIIRMLLEIFLFRSLFRNVKSELSDGKLAYGSAKWLWLAGLAFHYSFLTVLIRHLRFFTDPIPFFVRGAETLDGILQVGVPVLYQTDIVIVAAATYLLLRRLVIPQLRYISLAADYFPLFLILAIAGSGILMRYFFKTNIVGVKELTMGLVTFSPKIPEGIGVIFYVHLFLVSVLFAYFPFSKLMHLGGVFLSPTRNLANNNRMQRHINPWNYPVKVHTYEEYEDEFREKMKEAGLPVEKE